MIVNNILSDFYCRIKNGYNLRLKSVLVLKSKLVVRVLDVLLLEGFIRGYTFNTKETNKIKVLLKYDLNGVGSIKDIKGISSSGRSVYVKVEGLWNIYSQSSFFCIILSTSKGVISLKKALEKNIGGELLCIIY